MLNSDSADTFGVLEDEHEQMKKDDVCRAKVFLQKCATGQQKYPLLSKLVKALLSLPHGNADCE